MTLGAGREHGFWARKLLVEAGVDPNDLRLDVQEHVDRGVALAVGGFDSESFALVEGAVSIASDVLRRWRTPRPESVAGLVQCLESRHPHARGDAAMVLAGLVVGGLHAGHHRGRSTLVVAANDPYDRVAGPAALALARLDHPGVLDPVLRWLASGQALAAFGDGLRRQQTVS